MADGGGDYEYMFNPLKQMGDLKKMRDQAMALQKELQKEKITVEEHGVRIVIAGDQHIDSIEVNGAKDDHVRDAINKAVKKSQEVAAKKLAQMGGGLGGLLGGM